MGLRRRPLHSCSRAHVRVALGGGEPAVPQQLLDQAEVRALVRAGAWRSCGAACAGSPAGQYQPRRAERRTMRVHAAHGQPSAARVREQRRRAARRARPSHASSASSAALRRRARSAPCRPCRAPAPCGRLRSSVVDVEARQLRRRAPRWRTAARGSPDRGRATAPPRARASTSSAASSIGRNDGELARLARAAHLRAPDSPR